MKSTLPTRALFACMLTGLASVAFAQSSVKANMELSNQSAMSAADAAKVQPFCAQETGTRIRQVRSDRTSANGRATDCAISAPVRSYSQREIRNTGATDLATALQMLDPAIH